MKSEFLYINQNEIVEAGGLNMSLAIKAVENAFRIHGEKKYVQPPKLNLRKGPPGSRQAEQGLIMAMPSYVGGDYDILGIKWVLGMADNPTKFGLPRSSALTILNDSETGLPIAIIDGTIVNAVRTGAVTAVGAKYLARKNSETVCLIGAGPQGKMQLKGIASVLPKVKKIKIYDLAIDRAENLAKELEEELSVEVAICKSAEEAVRNSDIVITATIATNPYVESEWFKEKAFYADIASHDAYPTVYRQADKLFVDDWKQMKEHGVGTLMDGIRDGELDDRVVSGNLGEVVIGEKSGRTEEDDLIIFKHIGMSVTDIPVAYEIYKKAAQLELGTKLTLWNDKPIW